MADYLTDLFSDKARLDFMIKEQAVIESVFEINDSRDGFVESGYQCIIDDGPDGDWAASEIMPTPRAAIDWLMKAESETR